MSRCFPIKSVVVDIMGYGNTKRILSIINITVMNRDLWDFRDFSMFCDSSNVLDIFGNFGNFREFWEF